MVFPEKKSDESTGKPRGRRWRFRRSLCVGCLAGLTALAPGLVLAQVNSKVSLNCQDTSVKDCTRQLPIVIVMEDAIGAHKVSIQLENVTPAEGLNKIMEAAGIANYVVLFSQTGDHATISSFAVGDGKNLETVLSSIAKPVSPATSGIGSPASAEENQQQQKASPAQLPSLKELNELYKKISTAPALNPDTEIELVGGVKVTPRKLQAAQERTEVAVVSSTQKIISIPGTEEPLALKDIITKQDSVNTAISKIQEVTLPNGQKLTSSQVNTMFQQTSATTPKLGRGAIQVPGITSTDNVKKP